MKLPTHLHCTELRSPLGRLRLAASDASLVGVWFHDQRHAPDAAVVREWNVRNDHPVLRETAQQLLAYFAGQRTAFDLPLDLSTGTPFQRAVWQALLAIEAGHTLSYGALGTVNGTAKFISSATVGLLWSAVSPVLAFVCAAVLMAAGTAALARLPARAG